MKGVRSNSASAHRVEEVEIPSPGGRLRAGYYLPDQEPLADAAGAPCIVMAHGLGGTRAAGLEPFARRFADAGLRVLCFDYRHFGASGGEPRQWFSLRRQLADWATAIAYARALDGVDPTRIALWGSSMSGAHALAAAIADGRVVACSVQGAMVDGFAMLLHLMRRSGTGQMLRLVWHGLRDAFLAGLGGRRHRIPVVAEPGQIGCITSPGSRAGYLAITPPDWRNEISSAWLLGLPLYRPGRHAARLCCPALFCICTEDEVAPPGAMEAAARRAGKRAEVRRYPIGHFDIYVGAGFERASTDQVDFFRRCLIPVSD